MTACTQLGDVDLAETRSALYRAVALAFGPPGSWLGGLAEPGPLEGLVAALEDLGLAAPRAEALAPPSAVALEERRALLFGHTARGAAPPYETEYGVGSEGLFRQTEELADLHGFFHAFGVRLDERGHERADHVCCECELAAFLAAKEGYALARGDEAMLAGVREGTRLFLRDHLGRFAKAFGARLEGADPGGFHAAWGAVLAALVGWDCERLGVASGEPGLTLRPIEEDPAPMACGSSCPLTRGCGEQGDEGGVGGVGIEAMMIGPGGPPAPRPAGPGR